MQVVDVIHGNGPLVLGQPHCGTYVPDDISQSLNENGSSLTDTDWHIDRLYDDLVPRATIVRSNVHRYVIDVNRNPDGTSLYPGQNTTSLVPLTDFDGNPIWQTHPTPDEVVQRIETYHRPYHAAMQVALDRAVEMHGFAILFDCHSIRSDIPFLFEGQLPVFNIGTADGTSCAPVIESALQSILENSDYSTVLNGRFKGGWTTRHYGMPSMGVHAIQLEIAQRAYLRERWPWEYDVCRSNKLRHHLQQALEHLSNLPLSKMS